MVAKNKSNELRITRIYDAPVKAVWDAWTDPKQAAQWWGPRGFTITTHGKDLRPGGFWKYTMHGPDGVDYPNKAIYHEVEKHAKLVYDHGGNDDRPPLFRVSVLFSEKNGKTTMDMRMTLPTPEAAAETAKFIKKAGGDGTWDRLAEYLEKNSSGKEQFVINRTFDTDLQTMYEMWTDPKHLTQWAGPTGMRAEYLYADIRPGGKALSRMAGPGGLVMYALVQYLDLRKPNFIAYTQQFVDENEKPSRHPMAPTWPAVMLTTVQFTEEETGRTRVTLTWETHGNVTAEELATFVAGRAGMTQGWGGSFDKLDDYLK